MSSPDDEQGPRVVIRDRRRIDPLTGEPRDAPDPAAADGQPSAAGGGPAGGEPADDDSVDLAGAGPDPVTDALAERTADLQRLSAEYANYRRRVERDRVAVVELAQDRVLSGLLPVLDDIDRAREHGDLTGAFKAVADQLSAILERSGLEPYGEAGDPFDPTQHEAVMHSTSPDVAGPTCVTVLRRGYRHGERVLRPAMVAVADPAGGADDVPVAEPAAGTES